jgi:hypothetical protein
LKKSEKSHNYERCPVLQTNDQTRYSDDQTYRQQDDAQYNGEHPKSARKIIAISHPESFFFLKVAVRARNFSFIEG